MEMHPHHERVFVALAGIVGVTTLTNVLLSQRADQLENYASSLQSMILPVEEDFYEPTYEPSVDTSAFVAIDALSQDSGFVGDKVSIDGVGFSPIDNKIIFGKTIMLADSEDGMTLYFSVPGVLSECITRATNPVPSASCAQTKTQARAYSITVENDNGVSNTVEFTVKP